MEIKKIAENVYEIPKEEGMLVPVIVYASEKILDDIKKDKTLEQAKNVAHLPGILKYSIALPDSHQGYGFSIGGVAAFDMDKGVISPGGVGYDINCLSGDSRVLSEFGYYKEIKEFEKDHKNNLISLDKKNKRSLNSNISLFMKKNSDKIIKIKTESGVEILATKDHPIYTKEGMKKIEKIRENHEILLYPFEGIKYEKPEKVLLINEKDIDNLDRSFTSKIQIKKKLKELGLLPLYTDSPNLPYIIKIMGFVFGDGYLQVEKNDQVQFYGKKEDLEKIKQDIEKIGFKTGIYSRKRKYKIKTQYKEYEFERVEDMLKSQSSAFAVLLKFLGTPSGNKAKQDYSVPYWIMRSKLWQKRLFLASLFGAELSSPKTMTHNRFNFYGLVYSLNKENYLHGINFVNQISVLLDDFDIKNVLIKNREDEVNGKKSTRIRLMIYSDNNNLIKFFSKINYEYNTKKRILANAAIVWLKQKERILDFREETMLKAREMKENGFTKSQIINTLSNEYANKYFIDKAIYYPNYGKNGSRIAYCFISFNEFVASYCYGEGFIWDRIKCKEELKHGNLVYDLTMNDENHNFIANGVVVSNCSVRLLKTNLKKDDILKKQKEVTEALYRKIPSGVGRGSKFQLSKEELRKILKGGAKYMVERGYGIKEDYMNTEEKGNMKKANPDKVSDRAMKRGIGQLGTIGAGNHFIEVQYVDEIFDEKIAEKLGIEKNQVTIMIHCGSRGLGHQVASDYIRKMEEEYGFKNLPDRELINAPIKSRLGEDYFEAMCAAANFAFANKQLITHWVREEFGYLFPKSKVDVVYDVCHNIAKFEEHFVDGKETRPGEAKLKKMVCIHRKGATRSFAGQPVIVPGSMGTASYILIGTNKSEEMTFGSTVHGAGRVKSRSYAIRNLRGEEIKQKLKERGIEIKAGSWKSIAEEAPEVYKDIEEVVNVVDELGISKKVARLKPLVVVKG